MSAGSLAAAAAAQPQDVLTQDFEALADGLRSGVGLHLKDQCNLDQLIYERGAAEVSSCWRH